MFGLKLNWGSYITISFVLFASFILYLVYRSSQYKVDLVSEDYYLRELNYQQQLDKMNNANGNKATLVWTDSTLRVQFPELKEIQEGRLSFLRPSNSDFDKSFPVSKTEGFVKEISYQELKHGLYTLSIEWQDADKAYYQEEQIMVP
jgi:hypothetical protein